MSNLPNDSDKQIALQSHTWIKILIAWAGSLVFGVLFALVLGSIAILGFPGVGPSTVFGIPVGETGLIFILVVEIALIALVPLVAAWCLGYCRVQLWRWGLAGVGSLVAFVIGFYFLGIAVYTFNYWLTRSNVITSQIHAFPQAVGVACLLAVSWLGSSSVLRRRWKDLLLGLAVGIGLAIFNGVTNLQLVRGGSAFTLHDYWIVPPFLWVSAVYFIERAQGRADRTAFLVWLAVIGLMFVLPYLVIRVLR